MVVNKPHIDDQVQYLRFYEERLKMIKKSVQDLNKDACEYMSTNNLDNAIYDTMISLQDIDTQIERIIDDFLHDAEIEAFHTLEEQEEKARIAEIEFKESKSWARHIQSYANPR